MMDAEVILDIKNKYLDAQNLINNSSKTDPETEPFKSKYKGRDLLISLKDIVEERILLDSNNEFLKDILGVLLFLIANVSFDVEEIQTANEYVSKVLDILTCKPIDPRRIVCFISSYNLLGLIWSQRKDNEKALEYLLKAEDFHKQYKEEFGEQPLDFDTLFTGETKSNNVFEKLHTQTLFYLAQGYHHLGELEKAGKYCHTTLNRELMSGDFDEIDWALNAATFSQYLIERNAFKEARHHLAAASQVLDTYKAKLDDIDTEDEIHSAKMETWNHRNADVARCWVKYSIFLLTVSKERLLSESVPAVSPPPENLRDLKFTNFDTSHYEKDFPCEFILTYEDAKPVFIKSQEWLTIAKTYYTMEEHASDHIRIVQDSSQLYQLLIFYQPDEKIQCKMHKRRLDMLSKIVNQLNPTYYLSQCQELWFELGEICLAMADLKSSQITNSDSPDEHIIDKINQSYRKGIAYFEQYIKSFKNDSKQRYPVDQERSVLLAHMYLGRMYSKIMSRDRTIIIDIHTKSLSNYKALIDYCSSHEEAKNSMLTELGICKEMAEFIPIKLQKLTSIF